MSSRPVIKEYNAAVPARPDALRLHLNETPYGAPPGALAAARTELDERCSVYPDSDCAALRARIAAHLELPADMIAVGNGVDELVLLTALTFLGTDRTALVTETTFPGYLSASAAVGARVRTVPLDAGRVPSDLIGAALPGEVDVAFVCNPVNPTGTVLDVAGVERIIADAEARGTIVVFDEAYMDFAGPAHEHALAAVRAGRRAILLRTFSKAWGLAALRVGYAIGPADLIAQLWAVRQALPFNVNRAAQHAAMAALDQPSFTAGVRARTDAARARLYQGLDALDLTYIPSVTNFVLVHVTGSAAAKLAADHDILVRDLAAFGLPGCLRVTVGTPEQVDALCSALAAVLASMLASVDADPSPGGTPTLAALDATTMFNGYVGAHVVFALHDLGVWGQLAEGSTSIDDLCVDADRVRLTALLTSAALLGQVEFTQNIVALTADGRRLLNDLGFFTWGVGGYGGMLRALPALADGRSRLGVDVTRDEGFVASGSAEVGRSRMTSVEADVLGSISFTSVADLGCGDGSRLIKLCGDERRGVGIDISEAACALAAKKVADAGLADHLEIVCRNIFRGEDRPVFPGIELVSSFLMLHDLFAAVDDGVDVVHALRAAFPDARYFLLADTTAQPWAAHQGPLPPFSLEFELVHAFMGVPIRPREVYEDAFRAGGLEIERCEPLGVPSTWLYLLRVPR